MADKSEPSLMKISFSVAVMSLLLFANASFANEDYTTSTLLTILPYNSPLNTADVLGATGDIPAVPAAFGTNYDDTWFSFKATSTGVTIKGSSADFDMVLQILEDVPAAAPSGLQFGDAVRGTGQETMVYYGLTPGNTYYVRTYSYDGQKSGSGSFTIGVYERPTSILISSEYGKGTDAVGYDTYENIDWKWLDGATNWSLRLVDVLSGEELLYQTNSILNRSFLNKVPGICYGKSYTVYISALIDGVWTEEGAGMNIAMEEFPDPMLMPVYQNAFITDLYSALKSTFIANTEEYNWVFTTDNGNTVATYNSGTSNQINLNMVPGIRYNKIYNVQIQSKICGVMGPLAQAFTIETGPVPHTALQPAYCGMTNPNMVRIEWIAGSTAYWVRIYPTDVADERLRRLAGMGITYVEIPVTGWLNIGALGLNPGYDYAVQVKLVVGDQVGDWGEACTLNITAPPVMMNLSFEEQRVMKKGTPPASSNGPEAVLEEIPLPAQWHLSNTLSDIITIEHSSDSAPIQVRLFDMSGRAVAFQWMSTGHSLQLTDLRNASPGTYMVQIVDAAQHTETLKFHWNSF